jgi:glycolate oxidase FAD binding subunit
MRPTTEAELADFVAGATQPLHIRGGGTRAVGRSATGDVLETGGLSGIDLYEPGALTLVVLAGTPLAEIAQVLDAENQRLAFEPMDHRGLLGTTGQSTIGGVVAANVSGPRRVQAGACRDFMLGVRFVDGTGKVIKNGGRVMKNVTGYDLVKLIAGSRGTLGVLTEVSLKVLPKPETAACVLTYGLENHSAVRLMAEALGSPYDVSGAAHVPAGMDGRPVTMLRVEGFAGSVAYRAEKLRALSGHHEVRIEDDPEKVAADWASVRDVEVLQGCTGDIWRISCKPSDAPELVSRLRAEQLLFDWGGGLIWALLPEGTDARARLGGFGGHATLMRTAKAGGPVLPVFHPEPEPIAALSAGIRARFDPRGLFNPGLMAS